MASFALVDTAADERLYDLVTAMPEHACLFSGNLDMRVRRVSPFIVHLDDRSELAKAWTGKGTLAYWGVQFRSDKKAAISTTVFPAIFESAVARWTGRLVSLL